MEEVSYKAYAWLGEKPRRSHGMIMAVIGVAFVAAAYLGADMLLLHKLAAMLR